jgi:hypothetical protein
LGDQEKVEQDAPKQDAPKKDAPKDDWVSKRSRCSFPNVFKDLKLQVEEDVKTRNGLRPNYAPYEFSVTDHGNDFTVVLEAKDFRTSVIFSLAEHAIVVKDDAGNNKFEVALTFNDQGECRLHVDETELELWQVRRKALEELFFHGY